MEAYRAIVTKRDTRQFAPDPIPDGVLQRILQAGRMAGSAKNAQPPMVPSLRRCEAASTGTGQCKGNPHERWCSPPGHPKK